MKKNYLSILLAIISVSCGNVYTEVDVDALNGYWEIESVELPDGLQKEFSVNTSVDFMEVTGDSGIRKKVMPRLDGTFKTSKNAEKFQIKNENDSLHLYYVTPYANWKETVLSIKDSIMTVKNSDGKIFRYKKFTKFNISN